MKQLVTKSLLALAWVLAISAGSCHASAGDAEPQWEDDDRTYDRARRALDRGEILPVSELLERLRTRIPGEVVGIEFEREHGRWIYEFKIIDERGRLLEVLVDATTGTILSLEKE